MTFIDGELFDKREEPLHADPILTPTSTLSSTGNTACQENVNSGKQAVVGGNVHSFDDSDTVYTNATILIENGVITCISSTPGQCVYDNSFNVYTVKDATIIPGKIKKFLFMIFDFFIFYFLFFIFCYFFIFLFFIFCYFSLIWIFIFEFFLIFIEFLFLNFFEKVQ